ncbi:MAG: type II toxin-antitoxin system RelE/ParE family toxin [Patescibacteria group bacterium]
MDKIEIKILHRHTREFIFSLEDVTIGKIFRSFELLETFGHALGMPHVKHIGRGLMEFRVRGKQEVRLFFAFRNSIVIVLHGYVKKTMQIPTKELKMAQTRLKSFDQI